MNTETLLSTGISSSDHMRAFIL